MAEAIDRGRVRALLNSGAQLLDVLPPKEYRASHIPGAVNIPLAKLDRTSVQVLSPERDVIVYCFDYQWDLSPRAALRLESLGFRRVFDYVPGKADWVAYGLPIEGEDSSSRFVGDSLDRDVPTCRLRDPLTTVKEKAGRSATGLCPVVTEQGTVLGLCEFDSLPDDPKLVAEDVMKSGPPTLRPSYSIDKAGERLRQSGKKGILVTSSDGRLMGVFAGGSSS